MRPRLLLLTAASLLAVTHVVGVLFARPLWRPAELAAATCLLITTIRYDRLTGRRWQLSVAAGALVAGAALTVPAAPAAEVGLQVLSPEEYSGLTWRSGLDNLVPVAAALLFVLMLLAAVLHRRADKRRMTLAAAVTAALLTAGYVVLRFVVLVEPGATWYAASSLDEVPSTVGLPVALSALVPLLLALAAAALAVVTVRQRRWLAAAGALLFAAVAAIGIDAAVGAAAVPYAVWDYAAPFSLELIPPTDSLPQPTQALTAALRLAAAIVTVAGLTRLVPAPSPSPPSSRSPA